MSFRYLILPVLFLFSSCFGGESDQATLSQEDLEKRYEEIMALASSKPCTDASLWDVVALGSKPCGGPWEYLAYSKEIDVEDFLKKVKTYTDLQHEDNIKNDRLSDCMYVSPPTRILCEQGKPVLRYD